MSSGPRHYVPVLKCKDAEKRALAQLVPTVRRYVTPLIEIVERKPDKPLGQHLATAFKGLDRAVPSGTHFFLDPRELSDADPQAAQTVFAQAARLGLDFIPVTGVSRPPRDTAATLTHSARGACLRLTREDLEAGRLAKEVTKFLGEHALTPTGLDLIMDMGPLDNLVLPGVAAMAEAFLAAVPSIGDWRSLTLSGSAFPKSMGILSSNTSGRVDRLEWLVWRDRMNARCSAIPRVPTFSDCAIQHPSGVEGFDPKLMPVSASIRYVRGDQWLLVKGGSTRSSPPSVQFPNLARQLAPGGQLNGHFAGQKHCAGCSAIVECATGTPGLGSATVWRRIGTVHHITTVVEQLNALPAP